MATIEIKATLGATTVPSATASRTTGQTGLLAGDLYAAVGDAVAVLVADAASPTEAHVDDLVAALAAFDAAVAAAAGDAILTYDTAVLTTRAKLKAAVDALLQSAASDGSLTS